MTRRLYILLTLCTLHFALCTPIMADETILVGDVVSERTGQGIEGVNVHFRGTKIGTATDSTGAFALHVDMLRKGTLEFSAMGYQTQRMEIAPGTMAGMQVALQEKINMLDEVLVLPGENPAIALMQRVRAMRPLNDRTLLTNPEAHSMERERQLYVSHIGRRQFERALWRRLQEDSVLILHDSTYMLPLYRDRQTFAVQGTHLHPTDTAHTQALILSESDYTSMLGDEGYLNFYNPTITLMHHSFVSPLAGNANTYYRFYLVDSVANAEGKDYIVHFRTRNPFYATFNGTLILDSATAAVRSIEAEVPSQTSINYLSSMSICQQFAPDHSLTTERIATLLDFAVKTDSTHYFPTLYLEHTLKTLQTQAPSISPQGMENTLLTESLGEASPILRSARWLATIITTGYIPTRGPLDIGHVQELLQINDYEGVHIGLPLRTSERLWRHLTLEAAVGYGWRDRAFKGMGRVQWQLPTRERNILSASYSDRYVWSEVDDFDRAMRENSMGYGQMDFTSYAFESLHRDSLYHSTALRRRLGEVSWRADWGKHVETQTYLRITGEEDRRSQSLGLIARLSWGEKRIDRFFSRRYVYSSRYPVLYLGAEMGSWRYNTETQGAYHMYGHLRAMLRHHLSLGMGGSLDYIAQAGVIIGHVPETMLWHASANEGYGYDPYRYTLLHHYDLMGSRYAALQVEWNGQGVLFNIIPGVRYLRLRELVEAKVAYATKPYAEIGLGLGNILRVCDLYSVWRLTPDATGTNPRWALRFRLHIGL